MTTLEQTSIDQLQETIHGAVITPDDAEYDDARSVYNGMHDRRPAVLIRCADAGDVIAAVSFARDQGGDVSIRGGAHSAPGFSSNDDGVVIDLSHTKGIHVDPAARIRAR